MGKPKDDQVVDSLFRKMHEINTREKPQEPQPNVIQRAIKAAQDATRQK